MLKVLGNCRVQCECFDGKERQCHVRGKFRKKVWINKDDVILIGLRDYQDEKADVIHKYSMDEARQLRNMGHIPDRGTPLPLSPAPSPYCTSSSSLLP